MKSCAYLLGLSLSLPGVASPDAPAHPPLTLEQVTARVLEHNPQLQESGYVARAAAARVAQAGLATPLEAGIELENLAGTGAAAGGDALEATLSLARILERGGKPALRGGLARQEARLLDQEQAARRLDVLAEAARRFVHVVTGQERRVIAADGVELARRTRAAVERRVQAGKSPVVERRRAEIALARSELQLGHAQRGLATSRLELSTLWAETEPAFASAQADLFALPPVESFERLAQLQENNPDLLRFATRERLAEARVRLAGSRRRPDIEVSGGLRYLGQGDDVALVLSASLPLGSERRNAAVIEEARQERLREPLAREQRRLELHATLFGIYQELLQARAAVDMLGEQIIPQARHALGEYEQGYAAGRYSLLELTEAQRVLLDARLEAVMAAADYHRYLIEIDRLTGAARNAGVTP